MSQILSRFGRTKSTPPPTGQPQAARPPSRRRTPRFSLSPANRRRVILIAVIAAVCLILWATSQVWLEWWWFDSMGYGNVLLRRVLLRVAAFVFVAALGMATVAGSASMAFRNTKLERQRNVMARFIDRALFWIVLAVSIGTGLFLAWWTSNQWEILALWWHGRALGITDPVFHKDASFYLFALPALELVWSVLGASMLVALVVTAFVYLVRFGLNLRRLGSLPKTALRHLLVLAGVLLILGSTWFILENYRLVYSTRGAAFGVSFVDDHAYRIGNWAAFIVLFLAGIVCIASKKIPARRQFLVAGAVVVFIAIGINGLLPVFVNQFLVQPNELNKERPYIANNLAMTSYAYALNDVTQADLSGTGDVTVGMLAANPQLVSNVRLWDYRVAITTYQEVTSFAGYYQFEDVDVDRYVENGATQAVLISAREMNQDGLPTNAQTWVNKRLVYTHGYGVVVSPVDQVTGSGLPVYLVSQIPPDGTGPYAVTYPEIYYGEANLDWVIAGSKQTEFTALPDVPGTTSLTQDAIVGGVRMDDAGTKIISAIALGDRNVFLSSNITGDSTLLLHRNIVDRVHQIAPFLTLDKDPYLVVLDGRLVWLADAYTSSDKFPMSTPQDGINYIRDSVKVTVDARTGETKFYRTAEVDPVADAYGRMFPTLFTPISEAPAGLAAHFRYPEMMYNVQSRVYASIHVNDPDQFYNGEDKWSIPGSLSSEQLLEDKSERDEMPAYYLTIPLPGETNADFTLVPTIRSGRKFATEKHDGMDGRTNGCNGKAEPVCLPFPATDQCFWSTTGRGADRPGTEHRATDVVVESIGKSGAAR